AGAVLEADDAAGGIGHLREPPVRVHREGGRMPVRTDDRGRSAERVALDARDAPSVVDEALESAAVVVDEGQLRLVGQRIERAQMAARVIELVELAAVLARDERAGGVERRKRGHDSADRLM